MYFRKPRKKWNVLYRLTPSTFICTYMRVSLLNNMTLGQAKLKETKIRKVNHEDWRKNIWWYYCFNWISEDNSNFLNICRQKYFQLIWRLFLLKLPVYYSYSIDLFEFYDIFLLTFLFSIMVWNLKFICSDTYDYSILFIQLFPDSSWPSMTYCL